jgi:hypothetical protein
MAGERAGRWERHLILGTETVYGNRFSINVQFCYAVFLRMQNSTAAPCNLYLTTDLMEITNKLLALAL